MFNFSKFLFFFFNLRYIFSYSVWILSKSSSNFCVMLLTSKMSPLSGHASYNGKMSLCEENNVGINIMLFLANSCSTLKHQVDWFSFFFFFISHLKEMVAKALLCRMYCGGKCLRTGICQCRCKSASLLTNEDASISDSVDSYWEHQFHCSMNWKFQDSWMALKTVFFWVESLVNNSFEFGD